MKSIVRLFVLGGLIFSGCQEDPVIQTDDFRTRPVIYSIIGTEDSVHDIRIGRFFSGATNPVITARIADSIYFKDIGVKVTLRDLHGKKVNMPVEYLAVPDKKDGMFVAEGFGVYRFRAKVIMGEYTGKSLVFDSVYIEVELPGLPAARCSTSVVWPPRIWWPLNASQYIYMIPENPMRVLWSGDAWNEIDVSFQIHEQFPDTTVTRTFNIQKTNDVQWNGKYYEIKVPYELIVQILDANLKISRDLVRRYFGDFRIDVLTGNQDFDTFMKFRDGINDFNYNPYFNVDNGIGMLSGKSSTFKAGMHLDQASRLYFATDPVLKKLSFIEY